MGGKWQNRKDYSYKIAYIKKLDQQRIIFNIPKTVLALRTGLSIDTIEDIFALRTQRPSEHTLSRIEKVLKEEQQNRIDRWNRIRDFGTKSRNEY